MAEVIPSASTFDALTRDYTPERLVDVVFCDTPLHNYFRRNMIPVDGRAYTPIVEYASQSGAFYDPGDTLSLSPSPQIATRACFQHRYWALPVYLNAQDVLLAGKEAIIDVMAAYVRNGMNSARKALNKAFYTGNPAGTPKEFDSLTQACDNACNWGELDYTAYPTWRAHVMEGANSYSEPVSPSLENLSTIIREIGLTCGESPDLILVNPRYYDVLLAQYTSVVTIMDQVTRNTPVATWGFEHIKVNGVPVVADRDCPGEAWVSEQSTRADAKGYQAFLLNFKHLKLAYCPRRALRWEEEGWRRPESKDAYFNRIYFWGTIGGDSRRSLGRIFNVDIDQSPGNWTRGTVTCPIE